MANQLRASLDQVWTRSGPVVWTWTGAQIATLAAARVARREEAEQSPRAVRRLTPVAGGTILGRESRVHESNEEAGSPSAGEARGQQFRVTGSHFCNWVALARAPTF